MKKVALIAILLSSTLMLQGCVAAIVGVGAAGITKIATDPRTAGTQVDDTTLRSKVSAKLKDEADYFKDSRIITSVYNSNVLIVGQTSSQAVSNRALELVQSVEGVNKVYNQVRIGSLIGSGTITNDAWITTKIKSSLFSNKDTKARDIKVITEDGEVFLLGIVSREEGSLAADVASKVAGVKLVTTIFTYTD